MKTIKTVILFAILLGAVNLHAQKKTTWDYPVKPGTEEWKEFHSYEEKVNACQIPENILYSLSTEELAELCLQYPLIKYVFAFDNLNNGLDKLFSDFNGIREFYRKRDAANILLDKYVRQIQAFSFLDGKNSDYEKGKFIVSISILEILLSRNVEQNGIAREKSKEILQALVSGYEKKMEYADFFKGIGFRSNLYSRAKIIFEISEKNIDELPQKEKNSSFTSGMADEKSLQIIDELSYQLIR